MSINDLWRSHADFTVLQGFCIGTFFLSCNLLIAFTTWAMQQGAILEYGYPKMKNKRKKKLLKTFSFFERITLTRLCREAKRKSPVLWLYRTLHLCNLLSAFVCIAAYIGVLFTGGAGWAMMLLFSPWLIFFLSAIVRFIPDLLFLPSEKRRYSRKK